MCASAELVTDGGVNLRAAAPVISFLCPARNWLPERDIARNGKSLIRERRQ